jgi:hypothetical protein
LFNILIEFRIPIKLLKIIKCLNKYLSGAFPIKDGTNTGVSRNRSSVTLVCHLKDPKKPNGTRSEGSRSAHGVF